MDLKCKLLDMCNTQPPKDPLQPVGHIPVINLQVPIKEQMP